MIEKIQKATASSPEGARGLIKGVLACALQNVSFMLPVGLLYYLIKDMMEGTTTGRTAFYVIGIVVCFAFILFATWFQYNGTFFTTYKESGVRRLALAERLRKLPLSFFGKRDLADLTSTIMADCEVLEKTCSHYIPGLFVSIISTVLIALSLFAFDWRMALAALWVIPVSIAVLLASYKVQDRVQAKTMTVKITCADGIQEYIETIRDLNQGCDIVFDHVGFAYNSGETVLKDVSFTAKQGEVTALVGPSDGGKTTVSRLAARFWDHQQGSITVGGMDISKVDPEKLMGLYSIVFQDVTLFDNSILENIRLGRKDALYAQNGIYTHMVQFQTGSQNWAI